VQAAPAKSKLQWMGQVDFRTVPHQPYPADPNRDVLAQPTADQLFAALRADRPYPTAATGN
jgi:hypothetical protein